MTYRPVLAAWHTLTAEGMSQCSVGGQGASMTGLLPLNHLLGRRDEFGAQRASAGNRLTVARCRSHVCNVS